MHETAQKSLWLTTTPHHLDEEKFFTTTNFKLFVFYSNEKQNKYQFIQKETYQMSVELQITDLSVKVCKICQYFSISSTIYSRYSTYSTF